MRGSCTSKPHDGPPQRADGRVETEEYRVDLGGLRTSAGHEAKVFVTQTYDSPREPFPIGRGFSIPVGSYRFNATGASFLTHASRPISIEGQFLSGEFYDGQRTSGNVTLRIRPNRFLRSETTTEINDVTLAAGSFVSKVYRQRLALALTPQVLANVFVQYNDLSQAASVNCRVNWHYRPGSDIFLVYNQTWDGPTVSALNRRDTFDSFDAALSQHLQETDAIDRAACAGKSDAHQLRSGSPPRHP